MEVVSEVLYTGRLGAAKDKMWMTPGGACAATLALYLYLCLILACDERLAMRALVHGEPDAGAVAFQEK